MIRYLLGVVAALGVNVAVAAKPLVFAAPPRESEAAAQKLYGPLAEAMSRWAGEKVVFRFPGDWISYSRDMRAGKYDIVFDGPQFVSWRMVHLDAVPLASLPGSLAFVVATSNPKVSSLADLVAQPVCTLPSPNLGALVMLNQFKNPLQQPVVVPVDDGGFKAVYREQVSGRCVGAVYRTTFFKRQLTDMQRSKLKVLYTSPAMPNQTITAASDVPPAVRERIAKGLTADSGVAAASALFARFAHGATHFIAPSGKGFDGLNLLLENVVWGWGKGF